MENFFKNTLFRCAFIMVQFIFIGFSNAQLYYSMFLEHEYNSNPFGFPESKDDQISRISMGIQKDWENVSMQYFGSYLNYKNFTLRNFYWHQAFLAYTGEKTNWSLTAENRIDRSDYNIYDYFSVRGGFNHTIPVNKFIWRINGLVTLNTFQNFSELNNLYFSANTSFNRSFPTRTTLIGSATLNLKSYLKKYNDLIIPEDSVSTLNYSHSMILNPEGNGPGQGYGDKGRGDYNYYLPEDENLLISQLFLSLRIAQSLTNYTGIALQYQGRLNFNKQDRSVAGIMHGYTAESQIFDDPMGYQGYTLGAELTQLIPYQVSIKSAVYHQRKNYISQGIYIDDEIFDDSTLRKDKYQTVWVTIEKRFSLFKSEYSSFSLQLSYQWILNNSNSYWYDYNSQNFSGSIQVDL